MPAEPAHGRTARSLHSWLAFLSGDDNSNNSFPLYAIKFMAYKGNPFVRHKFYGVQRNPKENRHPTAANMPGPEAGRPDKTDTPRSNLLVELVVVYTSRERKAGSAGKKEKILNSDTKASSCMCLGSRPALT